MSYDITWFHANGAGDVHVAFAEWQEREEQRVVTKEKAGAGKPGPEVVHVVKILRGCWPGLKSDGAKAFLTDPKLQAQALVTADSVQMTLPYYRDSVGPMFAGVSACMKALAKNGFIAFDAQLDAAVTTSDIPKMKQAYLGVPDMRDSAPQKR